MMASSSGASSGSSMLRNSSSEEDSQQIMDQRKRKRMLSNRESARRSRQRKQKHLDDLMVVLDHLRKEKNETLTTMNVTTQLYWNIEAENSILRAQMSELTHRLDSLNEIINSVNLCKGLFEAEDSATESDNSNNYQNVGDDFLFESLEFFPCEPAAHYGHGYVLN